MTPAPTRSRPAAARQRKTAPSGSVCALGPFSQGVCLPAPAAGQCWSVADCGVNQACFAPTFCPCDVDCGQITHAGTCEALPPCCANDAACGAGQRCAVAGVDKGVCKPAPTVAKTCWNGADCAAGELCEGVAVCPCNADCDLEDTPGACVPAGNGCCAADSDCADDICVGQVCLAPPAADHRCWRDKDCAAGKTCHGAAICPCGADCDLDYEGPGVCVAETGPCTAIDESWVEEICDAASVVIWNGTACVGTCPGCCGTGGFSDLVFADLAACQAACAP
ncbi:MAG: Dickkopf N-terminal cysteine-rich domain-containing protein [Myxococcota bacterium]